MKHFPSWIRYVVFLVLVTQAPYVLALDKIVSSYTADGRMKRTERWKAGEVLEHWREFTYDPRTGQAATVSSPEGTIRYTYHTDGSLATIRTSSGYDVAYSYDALGNIKTVSGKSAGGIVSYTYNEKTGRKTKAERPNGVTTDYVYDTRGFLQSITERKKIIERPAQ